MRPIVLAMLLPMLALTAFGQRKPATVLGRVSDAEGRPLPGSSVTILGRTAGISTDDSGGFRITVPADRPFALLFSHAGHQARQLNFNLKPGSVDTVVVRLQKDSGSLREVVVTASSDRREAGLIRLDPGAVRNLPSVTGGVEALIKVFVGSNNELTSQYSVSKAPWDQQ